MADTNTTFLNLVKVEVGSSGDTWGTKLNANADAVDALFDTGPVLKVTKGGTGAGTAAAARTNLGLGTGDSPQFSKAALSAGTALLPSLFPTGDTNTGVWFPAADTIAASTGGSERLRVDSSGNVGIGTTSISKKFVVSNGGASGLEVDPFGRSGETATSLLSYNRSGAAFVPAHYDALNHLFYTSTTERMRIDASGNVGIGRTPVYKLDAAINSGGAARFATNSGTPANDAGVLMFTTSSATPATREAGVYVDGNGGDGTGADYAFFLHRGDNRAILGNQGSGTLEFQTGGIERMRVDNGGQVGIGTTPSYQLDVRAPTGQVNIQSTTGTNLARLLVQNTGGTFQFGMDNSAGSAYGGGAYNRAIFSDGAYSVVHYTNGSERMRLTANGGVAFGGATNYGTSGQILKSNGDAAPSWITTLPVANGGTGVSTSTGTGSVVLSSDPALSGTPTAPTAGGGTNNTQIATTAFVQSAVGGITSATTANVLSATAGAAVGAVGTYAFLRRSPSTIMTAGTQVAGSILEYTSAAGGGTGTPAGSWMLMGWCGNASGEACSSLWLRYV